MCEGGRGQRGGHESKEMQVSGSLNETNPHPSPTLRESGGEGRKREGRERREGSKGREMLDKQGYHNKISAK